MKFLYIKSGYNGIYPFFDQWIEDAAKKKEVLVDSLSPKINPLDLHTILLSSKPSFVLIMIGDRIPFSLLNVIKENDIPIVIWFTEDPFYIDISLKVLPFADHILSIDESACKYYQSLGYRNIHHFPLATNKEIFKPLNLKKEIDLLMIGYPYPNRIHLVEYLLNHTEYSLTLIGEKWRKFLKVNRHKNQRLQLINRWMNPEEVNQFYNQAKIILNPHREFSFRLNKNTHHIKNSSINNRFFDIYASGGFQLINHTVTPPKNCSDGSIFYYENEKDCVKKIHDYMGDHTLRHDIANLAYLSTQSEHTFEKRIEQLLEVVKG
ncbi:CgeB family protein [Metabacillus bambusae]|uniref:Glycosyltransferase n=1 Tax=Metabacillus bambusae TaxID=2795218 RepID=A0ABS3N651_9BACI|nr:glycosyltransferase [Metabacillus bambusae]MBO1513353.1 glycosyltransferase [Metabacillus bambusae]